MSLSGFGVRVMPASQNELGSAAASSGFEEDGTNSLNFGGVQRWSRLAPDLGCWEALDSVSLVCSRGLGAVPIYISFTELTIQRLYFCLLFHIWKSVNISVSLTGLPRAPRASPVPSGGCGGP